MSEVTAEMIERGRGADPGAAAVRRRQAAKIKDARSRLTSASGHASPFEFELIGIYAASRRSATPAMAALVLGICAAATVWLPIEAVLTWCSLLCAATAIPYAFAINFLNDPKAQTSIPTWRRKFALAEAIQGSVWAMIVPFAVGSTQPHAQTFVLFVLLLVAAMSAMLSASIPVAVYAALAPITIAIIANGVANAGYHTLMLTALAVGAQIYFVILANRLYASSLESLSFRKEKDALIAELEQAKANSDEARRRAEEANLAKSRFLATMSHELRTPLNAILGFSEVMRNELFGTHSVPAYKEYSTDIHSSGQHLLMLINEILDLSRVEAGRYELKEESVSLPHVVEDCQHLLALRAKNKDIDVTMTMEDGLPRVWADERAMRQVTLNLLTNAIKFTPQGGQITIKVGWTGTGGQYVSIRDTGPGIPENEIPIVLSSFGRGSLAQKTAEEGSGLGLPIVKGLIELHGGVFTLKSKLREGTEVIFVMPPERVMDALPQFHPEDSASDARRRTLRERRRAA